jgi:hypothetical protein
MDLRTAIGNAPDADRPGGGGPRTERQKCRYEQQSHLNLPSAGLIMLRFQLRFSLDVTISSDHR